MITLRGYQGNSVGDIRQAYRDRFIAPLLVSPTGSGKTVMFAFISQGTSAKGNKVLILVHRSELVDQTCRTLRDFQVPHGVIAAGRSPDRTHDVQVASVQTVVRRLDFFRPDLIIIDEAHHGTAGSWRKVIDANPQARLLGVTATPERLDGKGLKEVFDKLILGPEVRWLREEGHLSAQKYYAPPRVADLSGLHMQAGDYNRKELAAAMDKATVTGDAVEHYRRVCPGVPAVAFTSSIKHAEHVAEQFTAAGYQWIVMDGNMDKDYRREVVRMLGDGRICGVSSCDIINEGFDLPVVTAAILLRPTMSLGLHLQQIGRVLRPVFAPGFDLSTSVGRLAAMAAGPKPYSIILDHVGNCGSMQRGVWVPKHGFAEDEREWSLDGRKKKKKGKAEEQPVNVRQCPQCFCCHPPTPTCPDCGHTYEVRERKIEQVEGSLVEIDAEAMRREKRREQGSCQTLDELIEFGRRQNYKNPAIWAKHVWAARQGRTRAQNLG
jgi:superfamily II DNA or RNA helicase